MPLPSVCCYHVPSVFLFHGRHRVVGQEDRAGLTCAHGTGTVQVGFGVSLQVYALLTPPYLHSQPLCETDKAFSALHFADRRGKRLVRPLQTLWRDWDITGRRLTYLTFSAPSHLRQRTHARCLYHHIRIHGPRIAWAGGRRTCYLLLLSVHYPSQHYMTRVSLPLVSPCRARVPCHPPADMPAIAGLLLLPCFLARREKGTPFAHSQQAPARARDMAGGTWAGVGVSTQLVSAFGAARTAGRHCLHATALHATPPSFPFILSTSNMPSFCGSLILPCTSVPYVAIDACCITLSIARVHAGQDERPLPLPFARDMANGGLDRYFLLPYSWRPLFFATLPIYPILPQTGFSFVRRRWFRTDGFAWTAAT